MFKSPSFALKNLHWLGLVAGLWMALLSAAQAQTQKPEARVAMYRYRVDSTNYVATIQMDVPTQRLVFKRVKGTWQPSLFITLLLRNAENQIVEAAKLHLTVPQLPDSIRPKPEVNLDHSFFARPGKYTVDIKLVDANSSDTAGVEGSLALDLQLPEKNGLLLSDILLTVRQNEKAPVMPNHSSFISAENNRMGVQTEVYVKGSAARPVIASTRLLRMPSKTQVPGYGRIERKTVAGKATFAHSFDISQLESGNYAVSVDLLGESQQTLLSQTKAFSRINPERDKQLATKPKTDVVASNYVKDIPAGELRHILVSLKPIATESEYNTVGSLMREGDTLQMRAFLAEFWRRRDKFNPDVPLAEFRDRLTYADSKYKVATMRIHETDRGRVLLQYGRPNQVENQFNDRERDQFAQGNVAPYEIWLYYKIEDRNQSNIIFVFIQENQGNNNYKLVHSNAIGEVKYPNWRSALNNRNSNPNSFNQINDR